MWPISFITESYQNNFFREYPVFVQNNYIVIKNSPIPDLYKDNCQTETLIDKYFHLWFTKALNIECAHNSKPKATNASTGEIEFYF